MSTIKKTELRSRIEKYLKRGGVVRVSNERTGYVELTEPEDSCWITKQKSKKGECAIHFVGWRIWSRADGKYVTNRIKFRGDLERALEILGDNDDGNFITLEWNEILYFKNHSAEKAKDSFVEWVSPSEE